MKKMVFVLTLLLLGSLVNGQKAVDALFRKYAGKDGFVTLTMSGDLLKLLRCSKDADKDDFWPGDITEVRILVREGKDRKDLNFFEDLINDINILDYEEFMRVRNSDQDLRMLVRTEGNRFREFLLIGGGEDNLLIQVKGNMSIQEARKFSSKVKNEKKMKLMVDNDQANHVTIFTQE